MIKHYLTICSVVVIFCTACTNAGRQHAAVTITLTHPTTCNGRKIIEISGASPVFEPQNINNNQNYQYNGKNYKIIQDPSNFSQEGLADVYETKSTTSNLFFSRNNIDLDALQITAKHTVLPIPSYARITNLENNRMIVVRINGRGPYDNYHVISLSQNAAVLLGILNNKTRVRIDPIIVDHDGVLSGPGTICSVVIKQNAALPKRPNLEM